MNVKTSAWSRRVSSIHGDMPPLCGGALLDLVSEEQAEVALRVPGGVAAVRPYIASGRWW
jgi:hypothetical protein